MDHRIDEEMKVAKAIGRGFQTAKPRSSSFLLFGIRVGPTGEARLIITRLVEKEIVSSLYTRRLILSPYTYALEIARAL